MKRVLFILLDLLSIAFLTGGYVIHYFTKRKLGMVRWVIFKESKVRETMPIDILKYAAVTAALLLTVIIVRSFRKKRKSLSGTDTVMTAALVIMAAVYLGVTLFVTAEVTPAYFLILPMIGAASLLQLIRSAIAVWTCKDEK